MRISSLISSTCAAVGLSVLVAPIEAYDHGAWRCVGDIATPLRRYWSDDIECASWNGKDCIWTGNMANCEAAIEKHKLNVLPTNVLPLRCGDAHKGKWGGSGYNWCAKASSLIPEYAPQRPWECIDGINVPVRVNHWGDVECMSGNRRDCYWQGSQAQCEQLIKNPPKAQIPLDCADDHATEWGRAGYDVNNHWCKRSAEHFGVKK